MFENSALGQYTDYVNQIISIALRLLIIVAILYGIYLIIRYFYRRRIKTLNVLIDSFFNYKSYIEIAENLEYLKRHISDKKLFKSIEEKILARENRFYELIDYQIEKENHQFSVFVESEEQETKKRTSTLVLLKISIFGNLKSYQVQDKTGEELKTLYFTNK